MCGISMEVHEVFQQVDDLNHASSMSLRHWTGKSLVESRHEVQDQYQALKREMMTRRVSYQCQATGGGGREALV